MFIINNNQDNNENNKNKNNDNKERHEKDSCQNNSLRLCVSVYIISLYDIYNYIMTHLYSGPTRLGYEESAGAQQALSSTSNNNNNNNNKHAYAAI
jgi:hypothetical protein